MTSPFWACLPVACVVCAGSTGEASRMPAYNGIFVLVM
uniref:Uncharacterized protein n=1 Tax=Anguilla anguilla TaxID=7936 RepID=A0A0E9RGM1_ANGAN